VKATLAGDTNEVIKHRSTDPATSRHLSGVHGLQLRVARIKLLQRADSEELIRRRNPAALVHLAVDSHGVRAGPTLWMDYAGSRPVSDWIFQMRRLGVLNTRLALILPLIGLSMPFGVFWMRAHFLNFLIDISEAAEIDGANAWQAFRRIHLPLALPAIASLALLQFLATWNQFLLAIVLVDDPTKRTMAGALAAFQGEHRTDIVLLCARSLLIMVPSLAVFLLLKRQFVKALLRVRSRDNRPAASGCTTGTVVIAVPLRSYPTTRMPDFVTTRPRLRRMVHVIAVCGSTGGGSLVSLAVPVRGGPRPMRWPHDVCTAVIRVRSRHRRHELAEAWAFTRRDAEND
jgi:ABC-type molybdate transport system permease subunit